MENYVRNETYRGHTMRIIYCNATDTVIGVVVEFGGSEPGKFDSIELAKQCIDEIQTNNWVDRP